MITAEESLRRLLEGNHRFAQGKPIHPNRDASRRLEISQAQNPFAIVLGCADSRVPPELVFDCGLGDMFVFRTAGHAVDGAVLGSLEYGVNVLGIPLLMVLGHTQCGAVIAAIETTKGAQIAGSDLAALVEKIRPAVQHAEGLDGELLDNAVRANVEMVVNEIKATGLFSQAISQGRLQIVGACYDLSLGAVDLIC